MNKKRKTLLIALLSVFTTAGMFAACKTVKNITEVPTDKDYNYQNPDNTEYAEPDEGFVIDGKADEAAYKNTTWVNLSNRNGNDTVDLAMTSYFGEKGMYFVYDVTESTPIYVNPNRASYINSGIEMYFAPKGVNSMSNDHIYEIDLEANGRLTFKKSAGIGGAWVEVGTTNDIMARLATQPKGGEINSGDCYGYTLEFFIPWDYVEYLGMNPETMKEEYVSVNPVHITSYNYEGNTYQTDRYWYSFATQLGGDGWGNVDQYFRFNKEGVVGTTPVTFEDGIHCTVSGPAAAVKGLPVKVTVTPENGYAVSSLKCNGTECIKSVSYNDDGSATYTVSAYDSLTFSAEAEAVTAGNKNLTGKVTLKKAGGDSNDGLLASYSDASGEKELPLNANGEFSLANLAQGYYVVTVEKKGYGKITRGIYLNRNVDIQIDLEYGMFDNVEGTCWDISGANEGYIVKLGGRGAILSKDSYDKFYVEANFRYDEALAAQSKVDEYYQQRMGFRIKFSGGKYWHPDVMCEGGEYKVTYGKILNNSSIFNWNTVHIMNAEQIRKYKSAEGIKLGVLRVGTTAYIYLDGEFVAQSDLGKEGIKADETAQVGFEGFVYNSEKWTVDYVIEDNDPDVVSLGEVNVTGATAELDGIYTIGSNVTLVFNKQSDTDILLSLMVNGEEMSGDVISEDGADVLNIVGNTSRVLNVEAIYAEPREITANISVDPALKANGIEFTFTNNANPELVVKGTVANNRITVNNMLQGLYRVTVNVFGADLDLGYYSVVSEEEKLLQAEKVFINGNDLDPSVIDLSNGSFLYHSAIDENYSIKIDQKGDAYLAAKISLGASDKAKLLNGGEVSFGMYMTVEDANGKSTTHYTDFWIKKSGSEDWLSMRTGFGWNEDICKPFSTQIDSNKYSKALFGDGLYVVLRYNAETGAMETYFGANDFDVAYLRHWKDDKNLFPVNGTVMQLGFKDSLTWGGTSVTVKVENFRYGKTLLEALGVAGKDIVLDDHTTGGAVTMTGAPKAGDNVILNVSPDEGKILSSLTVNGVDMTDSVTMEGMLTIDSFTAAMLKVEAVFVEIQYADSLQIALNGRKYGVEGNAAEGKTVTLKNGQFTYTGSVTDGKVTFEHVALTDRYTLSIDGFISRTGLTVTENGIEGVTGAIDLEYDMFYAGSHNGDDWKGYYGNPSKIDKSHVNDANAYFVATDGTGDLYQYTHDVYNNVSVSMTAKADMTNNNPTIGLVFEGNKAVLLRIERQDNGAKYKVQWIGGGFWEESCINDTWDFGIGEEFYNPLSSTLKTKYETEGITLTLVRNGGNVFAYVDGVFVASQSIPAYADKTCRAMFGIGGIKDGTKVPFGISDKLSSVTVTNATEENANGTVTVAETAVLGQEVTVTLTPAADYKVETLLVNGVDVTGRVSNDQYRFFATANTTVKATFVQIEKVDFTLSVIGKKLGFDGNALNGVTVTLSDGSHTYTGTVSEGSVAFTQVISGKNYTLSADKFLTARDLEVLPQTGIVGEVTLEYDTFQNDFTPWGSFDYSKQNDKEAQVTFTNNCCLIYTKDTFDDVTFSVYLNRKDITQGNQGIFVRFIGDNFSNSAVVRLERNEKIHFIDEDLWGITRAEGSGWQNLVHFNNNNEGSADADSAAMNKALNDGTCKLTVVRRGATLYVFISYGGKDRYIGSRTYNSKYENAKAQIGVYTSEVNNNNNKTMKVELVNGALVNAITDATTDTNGTVVISNTMPYVGDKVTLTLTPNSGYIVKSLSVGGNDVTGSVTFNKETLVGTYEFTSTLNADVVATFEQATYGGIEAAVSGAKYGETDPIDLNGKKIKFSNAMAEYELTVTDGKIVQSNILAGVYTVTSEGYTSQKITVTAGSTYSDAVTLAYQIFTEESASADLSKINEGKVTATGKGGIDLSTKEKYVNFTAEAHFDVPDYNSRRYCIALMFADGKNFRIDFAVQDGGNNILQQTNWDSMMFNWEWVNFPEGYFAAGSNSYNEVEIRSEFMAKGLTYKLERDGATVKLSINGVLMNTYTLPEAYASQSAQLRFIMDSNGTDGTKGFTFEISETAPAVTGTKENGES